VSTVFFEKNVERPEFRSQKMKKIKKILKRVGIPGILLIWKQNLNTRKE
jgi:hypothetical protein